MSSMPAGGPHMQVGPQNKPFGRCCQASGSQTRNEVREGADSWPDGQPVYYCQQRSENCLPTSRNGNRVIQVPRDRPSGR